MDHSLSRHTKHTYTHTHSIWEDTFYLKIKRFNIDCTGLQDCHNKIPHIWVGLNNRYLVSCSLGARSPRQWCQQASFLVRPPFLVFSLCLPVVFPLWACITQGNFCVQISFSNKETSQAGLGPTRMTSFNFSYHLRVLKFGD